MDIPSDHPAILSPKIGVLLVNLGTPDAPDPVSVKRYLKEFLSDRRVVEIPPLLWQPILRGFILNTRPQKSSAAYTKIWMDGGSPLAIYTKRQAEALQSRLGNRAVVDWAMRYGNPSLESRLIAMQEGGCDRILLAALYPQYSAATTATVHDKAFDVLKEMRWQPALRTLPPYHDNPAYIAALKTSVDEGLAGLNFTPDALVISFHGMPERTLYLGDPYHCQCRKTARLLSEAMGRELVVSFQSRFGRAKWLEPATDATLIAMPEQGVKKVAVFAPGFSVDCIETLEELAMEGRDEFIEAGGTDFSYIPCLNDSATGMEMLEQLVRNELGGWI